MKAYIKCCGKNPLVQNRTRNEMVVLLPLKKFSRLRGYTDFLDIFSLSMMVQTRDAFFNEILTKIK